MPEEWLLGYYETGDNDYVLLLISHYTTMVDRFLKPCVSEVDVRLEIWVQAVRNLRDSRKHPELHWDLKQGSVTGFVLATAGHLMYRWLVWFEYPDADAFLT